MTIPILPGVTSPVVAGNLPYPGATVPFDDVVPFTSRSGATFAELFYGLRAHLDKTIIPHVNTEIQRLVKEWDDTTRSLIDALNAGLTDQAARINDALSTQQTAIFVALSAQTTEVKNEVSLRLSENETTVSARLADFVVQTNAILADITASAISVSDPVIAGVVSNNSTQTIDILNGRYGTAAIVTLMESLPSDPLRVYIENVLGGYAPETVSLFKRIDVRPSERRRGTIDTFIRALKNTPVWGKLDALYVFAAHTDQAAKLNWKANQYNLTAVNSPLFTPDVGYTPDGKSQHLYTQNSPYSRHKNDDLSLFMNIISGVGVNNMFDMATHLARINSRIANNQINWRANTPTTLATSQDLSYPGLYTVSRLPATNQAKVYKNGVELFTSETAPNLVSDPTDPVYVFRYASVFSDRPMSFAGYGAGLTNAEVITLQNAFNAYTATL